MEDNEYILGIDFGTTFSCVGVWKDGSVLIIPNGLSERITPSVVIFDSKENIYVGEETINKVWDKDIIKIYEIKRLIGKTYTEVQDIINYFSYKVIKGDDDQILISMDLKGKKIKKSPEEIAYLIFQKLISNAEKFLGKEIHKIIVTVPADFTDRQRSAIKSAAEMIKGITVKKIINEPSAAVLCYGIPKEYLVKDKKILNKNSEKNINMHPLEEIYYSENNDITEKDKEEIKENEPVNSFKISNETLKIIVFDLGGGTYDVSLIEYSMGIFDTLASAGNAKLGGGDFDNRLMEYCLNEFCNKNKDKHFSKDEIYRNKKGIQRLKIKCEQTKKYLSIKMEDTIYIEDFYEGEALNCIITRSKFEDICKTDFDKLIPPLDRVLSDQKLKPENINEIVLVGGSSKIPKIKQILTEKFPNVIINDSINPEEAVAYGAVIFSETERKKIGDFWEDFDYLDSIQHSYGIEIENGKMEFILKRGSKYPTKNTKYYFTYSDYQTNFRIKIYEGENDNVKDNEFLDEFILNGIPKKKKGDVCLTVTFSIDENQILNVTAFVAEKEIKKKIEVKRNRKKYVINTLLSSNTSSEENKKEKEIKDIIVEYSKKFIASQNNDEKLLLIEKYNEAIIFLLKFLEKKDLEVYFNFIERLFQSYAYIINNFFTLLNKEQKEFMYSTIKEYMKDVTYKNPFKLKILISNFKVIDTNISPTFYVYSIIAMDFLSQIAEKKYFPSKDKNSKNNKNNAYIAKNIYEECISIAIENLYFNEPKKNEEVLFKVEIAHKLKYKEVLDKCKKQILLISVKYLQGNNYTKGKLFENNENLDFENLSLMSNNLSESLNKLKDIDEKDNKEILELGGISYANFVKIEFLKDKNRLDPKKLLEYANKSIKLAESLGKDETSKEWYKEIVKLKKLLEKKIKEIPEPEKKDFQRIKDKLEYHFGCGNEELVIYLLKNYPVQGNEYSENKMQDYNKNKNMFLKKLASGYKKADKFLKDSNEDEKNINENFDDIKPIILEYINNMMNRQKNQ